MRCQGAGDHIVGEVDEAYVVAAGMVAEGGEGVHDFAGGGCELVLVELVAGDPTKRLHGERGQLEGQARFVGELEPDQGTIKRGARLQVAYYDQQREQLRLLSPDRTRAHVVQRGDTLSAIAGRYYDTPADWRLLADHLRAALASWESRIPTAELNQYVRALVQESNRREKCPCVLEAVSLSTPALCDAAMQQALCAAAEAKAHRYRESGGR